MGTCCGIREQQNHGLNNSESNKILRFSENIKNMVDKIEYTKNLKNKNYTTTKQDIKDKFKFISILGTGLFSKVYLVKEIETDLFFAMKVVDKERFQDKDQIKKILIEKEIMMNLKHRNILQLFKTFQTDQSFYFLIEYAQKGIFSYAFFNLQAIC